MTKPTLLVLAAGMGSRYGGLKQMDPVGPAGETIIDYSVHDAIRAGCGKVVFVIRPDFAEVFKRDLGSRFEKHIAVDYAYQELGKLPAWFTLPPERTKPWGTAHAVLMAKDLVKEPFLMINADDFYGRESFEVVARHLEKGGPDYCMAGYRLKNTLSDNGTVARGVCASGPDGNLTAVDELTKIGKEGTGAKDAVTGRVMSGEEIVSMNFFGFSTAIFGQIEGLLDEFLKTQGQDLKSEIYIPKVLDRLIRDHKAQVKVLPSNGQWFGVTYREDAPLVKAGIQRLVSSGAYPSPLFS
ncbi:MAG: sugar phosphate nucleotidyltransferase [candidate division FCPU426 bacterium]